MVDPLEEALPDVGRVSLEDAETGAIYEVNTADASGAHGVRQRGVHAPGSDSPSLLRRARVDSDRPCAPTQDYLPALRAFFQQRERRIARR